MMRRMDGWKKLHDHDILDIAAAGGRWGVTE
jgi:hypothetical protein